MLWLILRGFSAVRSRQYNAYLDNGRVRNPEASELDALRRNLARRGARMDLAVPHIGQNLGDYVL